MPSSYNVSDPPDTNGDTTVPETKFLKKSASEASTKLPTSPSKSSRSRLNHGQASTASMRQRYGRRQSSFTLPHVNSYVSEAPSDKLDEIDLDQVPWWTSERFKLSILCFLGFAVLYAQRVNLSIAIVSMVKEEVEHYKMTLANSTYNSSSTVNYTAITTTPQPGDDKCPELSKSDKDAEFDWDKKLTGLILGAFFWGYLVLQVPGGRLSETFGAKRVIGIAMFPVAILNILSPPVARANKYAFLVLRVFVGVGEGVMYPAAQALWSKWAPPNERSRLIGFSYAGGQFGNAIIFPIGGYLCAYGFDGGWASVFYVIGSLGFLWCVAWMIWAKDTPDDNKKITELEKKYIQYSLGDRAKGKMNIPWVSIFTSPAVWAIVVAHTCGNYGAYMMLTKIPAYMKEVLKFDIKANGVLSMIPYLVFWIFISISSVCADALITKEVLSVAKTRKLMAAIGMFFPALALIGTGFMECDQQVAAVVLLTLSVGLCGFQFSGFFINHGDIAPAYAGTLFGISNTAATTPGIFSPYVVSAMTPNGTRAEWQSTFYIAAAVYIFGAIWYGIFGKGEVLPWAEAREEGDDEEGRVGFGLNELEQVHEEDEAEDDDDGDDKRKEKGLMLSDGGGERPKDV